MLDLTYTQVIRLRDIVRRLTRPTELGVRALVVRGDEVLLICHRGGATPWSLPGGGVRRRERLSAAAQREVREEAGCPVRVERLHGIFHNFGEGFNNYVAVFVCAPLAEPQPPRGNLEIRTAAYASLRSLPAGTDPATRRRVDEYLRGESGLESEY